MSGGVDYHDWSVDAYQSLKSLIAFPIWEFGRNNYGDPRLEPLPDEFVISASVCRPYYKIILDYRLFIAYLFLQSTVLTFCWAVIIWRQVSKFQAAELSLYPVVDCGTKLVEKNIRGEQTSIWDHRTQDLYNAESGKVLKTLKDVQVVRRRMSKEKALRDMDRAQIARVPSTAAKATALAETSDAPGETVSAGDGDKKDTVRGGVSGHVDQHR